MHASPPRSALTAPSSPRSIDAPAPAPAPPASSAEGRVRVLAAKVHVVELLRAHDRLNLRRIPVVTAIRALNVGGLALSEGEAAELFKPFLVASSPGELHYLDFCAAFNDTLPPGFLEQRPAGAEAAAAAAAASAGASALAVSPVLGGSAGAFVPLRADERAALDAVLARVRHAVMTRGLAPKLYLRDFDQSHRGVVTATRFGRVLSATLPGLGAADMALLAKAYSTADGVDVRYLVFCSDVTPAEDATTADAAAAAAAAAAAWPVYGSA